jgi:hypothetical protein
MNSSTRISPAYDDDAGVEVVGAALDADQWEMRVRGELLTQRRGLDSLFAPSSNYNNLETSPEDLHEFFDSHFPGVCPELWTIYRLMVAL